MFYSKARLIKISILLLVFIAGYSTSLAQSHLEVRTSKNKTSVVVTNFPKNATVLIIDEDLNLLSITSTNDKGTATVNLDREIKNTITARTIHGDYEVSNKSKTPSKNGSHMVVNGPKKTIKA